MSRQPGWMRREGRWLDALVWVVVALLCVLPIGRLVWAALVRDGALDPTAAIAIWATPSAAAATVNTLVIGVVSAALATTLGTVVAVRLAATDVRAKRLLALSLVAALLVAPQVVALAFKTLAGPASPLLGALGIAPPPGTSNPMLGIGGVVFVLALHHLALAAITVATGLATIPRSLIEAAMLDGATPTQIARRVILPLIAPQIAAALVVTFVAGAGNFGIPALLGTPAGMLTLPTLIYRQLSGFGPAVLGDVASLALLAALIAVSGVALGRRLGGAATPLPADERFRPFCRLGRARLAVEAALWALVAIAVVIPLASLVATALVPAAGVPLSIATATLDKFREVLIVQAVTTRALANSLDFAGTAAAIAATAAIAIAYAAERRSIRGRGALMLLAQLPYAVPGVVLAIAMILLLLRPLPLVGVSLYGTSAIIVIAYVARFLAVALAPIAAALGQLAPEQEEAAAVFGASLTQRLRFVVLPAILPTVSAAILLIVLMAFNELTVSALLWSAGTETLGVALLSLEDAGLIGEAAALGCVTTAVVAAIVLVLDRARDRVAAGTLPWSTLAGDGGPMG